MIGNGLMGVRTPRWSALCSLVCFGLLSALSARTASAADCPGHPDALGTSRTLVVDPREHTRIGTMQYGETLPLEDHEVVLSFDDGPLPRNSNQVLEILASQCVKATFFIIGQMARTYPEGVRKLRDAGHTIGTHTQNHPLTMNRMPIERARQEIDDGIASVKAALGDDAALAPFFRYPGLIRSEAVEDYVASKGIQTWSADFPADDWRHIPSSRVYDLAMQRIEAKGKGVLLLHDIQPRTVAALPRILNELKARGYRIVHVVPATPERPATPTEPQQWQLHPTSETVAISHWPKIPNFAFAEARTFAAPALSDFAGNGGQLAAFAQPYDRASRRVHGASPPQEALWPAQSALLPVGNAIALPVPAQTVFQIQEMPRATARSIALLAPRTERTAVAARKPDGKLISVTARDYRLASRGKPSAGRIGASHATGRKAPLAANARRGTLKHLVQAKKGSV
jgi:peptidoglycan-N-acetylglucosamine deacetylase